MKSGAITENDIALSQKKLQINTSPLKVRVVNDGTNSAKQQERGVPDAMLMGKHKNLRSSGVDQITKL